MTEWLRPLKAIRLLMDILSRASCGCGGMRTRNTSRAALVNSGSPAFSEHTGYILQFILFRVMRT